MSDRPASSDLRLSVDSFAPFFEARHAELGRSLTRARLGRLTGDHDGVNVARAMGELGLYVHLVPQALGGATTGNAEDAGYLDVRAIVLVREALAEVAPMADAIFAVQGLGSYPIAIAGTDAQRASILPQILSGARIAAFGLTEPEAGSDVASLRTTATRDGDGWLLDGEKTLISNVPMADHVIVFANADPSKGRKGITAFLVDAKGSGVALEAIRLGVPHPIGRVELRGARVPDSARVGEVGQGFRIAMETLDAFRIGVGAAANGMASRALELAIQHVTSRRQFGGPLADQQLVRAHLADMATELDAARLLVTRAAHLRDTRGGRVSTEAAMAKMYATEAAQRIIDLSLQLHGGRGCVAGVEIEALYREIRPLRIYEGATDIQKLVIAKGLLDRFANASSTPTDRG